MKLHTFHEEHLGGKIILLMRRAVLYHALRVIEGQIRNLLDDPGAEPADDVTF